MTVSITPYQRFYEFLKTPKTKINFELYLRKFFEYSHTHPDGGSFVKLDKEEKNQLVWNYIVHLKLRVEKNTLSSNSIPAMIAPIKFFCDANEIELNWRYFKKLYPRKEPLSNQGLYTDQEIKKLLDATPDKRNKSLIHLLASGGARVGELNLLKIEDIKPIEDGAIIWIYNKDKERYRSCITPETYNALKEYFNFRILNGQPVTNDKPVFCKRNHKEPLSSGQLRQILPRIMQTAGLRGHKAVKNPDAKSPNHAFRKRFHTILTNVGIPSKIVELLNGSFETTRDKHYLKLTDEELWSHYKIAIPLLTIDKSEKFEIEKQLAEEALNKQSEVVKEEIDSLKERNAKLEADMDEIKDMIRKGYRVNVGKAVYDEYGELVKMKTDDEDEWDYVQPRCPELKQQKEGFDFFPKKKKERKTERVFIEPNCPNY